MSELADAQLRRAAAGTLLSSFPGDTVPSWVWRQADAGLGGICLYGSNRGADVSAVAAALHDVRPDLVVALDEEGGDVTRLEAVTGSSVPGNAALGAVDDVGLTRSVAAALGAVLREVGVDLDLAPCADVNSDPTNPVIGVRSFGADAELVARHTVAFVAGLQSAGVAACAKHFPGHGAVAVDSHVSLPTVAAPAEVLRARELVPFQAAIDGGVAAVMPGHLLVPAFDDVPATVSRRIVTDLLRDEMGFAGLVVTDALDMGGAGGPDEIPANVARALAAGADLCCLGPDNDEALVEACIDAIVAAVVAGDLAVDRVVEAAERVAALRPGYGDVGRGATPAPGHAPGVPASLSAAPVGEGRQRSRASGAEADLASLTAAPVADRRQSSVAGLASGERSDAEAASEVAATGHAADRAAGPPDPPHARSQELWVALVTVGTEAAERAVRVEGAVSAPTRAAHVVELDRPANIAAGIVPWGVAGALAELDPTVTTARIAEGDSTAVTAAVAVAADRPLVVVVRDPRRRPAQAAALAALLGARPDAVVIDMGWPDEGAAPPSAAARITTYGASRASGQAAARLLVGLPAAAPAPNPTSATPGRTSRG